MRRWTTSLLVAASLCVAGFGAAAKTDKRAVIDTYARIAHAKYEDSIKTAKALRSAINALIAQPSATTTLAAAKKAWLTARVPYQQTEVYRFGNAIVDDWEGKVNAWPLDEGLIDYVAASYGKASPDNPLYTANVIANRTIKLGGKMIDVTKITPALLESKLHEAGKVEANVATGYHAVEFLLWGQDLNGTNKGAGNRPWTDFSKTKCTNGNCERRAQYLKAATDLLVTDLTWMAAQWAPGGKARAGLVKGDPNKGLAVILTGMGSLSYGELAGERMKLGLLLHDPEEEHDCFSDNTHNSHYYNVVGMMNVYTGSYTRIDGTKVTGPSLAALVGETNAKVNADMLAKLKASHAAFMTMKKRAETIEAYDQMIGKNNPKGNAVVQAAIDSLLAQTKSIETVVTTLGLKAIEFEDSDSLDGPEKVFQ